LKKSNQFLPGDLVKAKDSIPNFLIDQHDVGILLHLCGNKYDLSIVAKTIDEAIFFRPNSFTHAYVYFPKGRKPEFISKESIGMGSNVFYFMLSRLERAHQGERHEQY
jgi:hypothetical protein